jgi:hypothetical protein
MKTIKELMQEAKIVEDNLKDIEADIRNWMDRILNYSKPGQVDISLYNKLKEIKKRLEVLL